MRTAKGWAVVLGLALAALATAQGLRKEIEAATTREAVKQALETHQGELGDAYYEMALDAVEPENQPETDPITTAQKREVLEVVTAAESLQRTSATTPTEPRETAARALQKAGFRDPGQTTTKNWAARGADKVWDAIRNWLEKLNRDSDRTPMVGSPFLGFLQPLVWLLLGVAVLGFLAWALYTFAGIRKRKAKQAGGLMDDDEPERTADEWLTKADELERQGEFRLAVRCLYVATLIRLDEGNVARFRRWETNWEHLHRIDSSPRKPEGYSIRPATEKFDLVWYGHQVNGKPDLDLFRSWYREAMAAMGRRVA